MNNVQLSLIVLRTSKMEETLAFYKMLGFTFVEEQHGSGPVHYSTQIASSVLEIYPGDAAAPVDRKASGATMLGFSVASVDNVLTSFQTMRSQVISGPKDSQWGRRAVVADPDGRAIELSEPKEN
jgi:predicted enzyme related to lactoylglutathione lyase